jgi:hypothetical protein
VTYLAAASASAVVPGILGFLVVAGMAVALFFLLRSMNKQLSKVVPGPKWREDGRAGYQSRQQAERNRRGVTQLRRPGRQQRPGRDRSRSRMRRNG